MKKLKNNSGAIELIVLFAIVIVTVAIGHPKYMAGEWGANGTEAVHVDRDALWYNASHMKP